MVLVPVAVTDKATRRIKEGLLEASRQLSSDPDQSLVRVVHRSVGRSSDNNVVRGGSASGSHVGTIDVELCDTSTRDVTAQEIVAKWREVVGVVPGVERLSFGDASFSFRLLPRVWLAVVLHLADDEFPASANVLFDAAVSHYLPTEDLAVLGGILTGRLIKAAPGKSSHRA